MMTTLPIRHLTNAIRQCVSWAGDSKEAEWADLYASDAHQQQQAWADDYASAEELAAVRGSDGAQWAAEYEEQQHDEDEYGNAEDYDPEDWTEDFNYLDWNSLNAAKQAMNGAGTQRLITVHLFLERMF